ncbi:hypothetical protein, partial [uncultured Gimesia sp.]|uniref:hypothetical protein n=1 Tax=uncultured Gimesia sp. TaxID=1678688 RepID=UPI00261BC3E9
GANYVPKRGKSSGKCGLKLLPSKKGGTTALYKQIKVPRTKVVLLGPSSWLMSAVRNRLRHEDHNSLNKPCSGYKKNTILLRSGNVNQGLALV